MVTEFAEAVEAAPICKRHGVEKVRRVQKRSGRGWDWLCPECRNERQRGSGRRQIAVGEYTVSGWRLWDWRGRYGLEPEDVVALYEAQGKKCAFGGEPLAWKDINVDHKHKYPGCREKAGGTVYGCPKEAVRGLVCRRHNSLQGHYESDPEGYLAVARWHVEHNGGKWTELCGCQEKTNAA